LSRLRHARRQADEMPRVDTKDRYQGSTPKGLSAYNERPSTREDDAHRFAAVLLSKAIKMCIFVLINTEIRAAAGQNDIFVALLKFLPSLDATLR